MSYMIYEPYMSHIIWFIYESYDPYDMRLILWGIINFPITVHYSKIFFHSFHSMKNVNVCWDLAVFTFIVKLEFLAPYESVKICESMNGFVWKISYSRLKRHYRNLYIHAKWMCLWENLLSTAWKLSVGQKITASYMHLGIYPKKWYYILQQICDGISYGPYDMAYSIWLISYLWYVIRNPIIGPIRQSL